MTTAALNHLDHLDHLEAAPKPAIVHLRRTRLAQMSPDDGVDDLVGTVIRQLRRDLIEVETAVLTQLYHQGTIDEITRRKLQRRLDLEDASLDY